MVNVDVPDKPEGLAIGANVAVRIGTEKKYFKITNRDTFFLRDNHSALAKASIESYVEITNLDPPSGQLYQIYSGVIDGNLEVQLKQPAATNRWGTHRSPTGGYLLDKVSSFGSGELLNVWVLKDYPPNVQLYNGTNVTIKVPTIWWVGWRYDVELLATEIGGKITQGAKPVTFVEVGIGPPGQ